MNIEAEQAVLGILLFDPDKVLSDASLGPWLFQEPLHARLFAQIKQRVIAGMVVQPTDLCRSLEGDSAFVMLGGLEYLADLIDVSPPASNLQGLVETLLVDAINGGADDNRH